MAYLELAPDASDDEIDSANLETGFRLEYCVVRLALPPKCNGPPALSVGPHCFQLLLPDLKLGNNRKLCPVNRATIVRNTLPHNAPRRCCAAKRSLKASNETPKQNRSLHH